MLDLKLIAPWEKFILMDPNLDEDGARAKLEEVEEFNQPQEIVIEEPIDEDNQEPETES